MGDTINRKTWVDSLKGLLMMLVVIGHAIQSVIRDDCYENHLWNIIYSFHMPAFMALSGYLLYKGKNKSIVDWGGVLITGKKKVWAVNNAIHPMVHY